MKDIIGLISTNYPSDGMGQLTADRPLASMPFGGRYRLVDFALSNMENSGITTVGMITPYMYRSLLDHVGVGKEWGLSRKEGGMFILPGSIYGYRTVNGKFLMRDLTQNMAFLERGGGELVVVTSGDKICNMDFREIADKHEKSAADITLVYKNGNPPEELNGHFLQLDDNGRVIELNGEGTSHFLDTFIINRQLLLNFCSWYSALNYMDFMDIVRENLDKIDVRSYEYKGFVASVAGLRTYMGANSLLLREEVRRELFRPDRPIHTKVQDATPAKYMTSALVRNALVPTGCIIDGTVEDSILFRGVHIGKGAVVKNCVIMPRCVIGEGAVLENVICDKYTQIKPGVKLCGSAEKPIVIGKKEEV